MVVVAGVVVVVECGCVVDDVSVNAVGRVFDDGSLWGVGKQRG